MKSRCLLIFVGFVCLFFSGLPALSQALKPGIPPHVDPSLDAKGNGYLDRQSAELLKEVNNTLAKHPPQPAGSRERYLGLLLLDAVMHDVYAAYRPPVQHFFHERIEKALFEIEHTKVKEGAVIWRLYNMGFIVRTPSVTFAFDLTSAKNTRSAQFALPDSLMNRLVRQCDALFISHFHWDHADESVANQFIRDGKPVVAPPQVWQDKPIFQSIKHLKRQADTTQILAVQGGRTKLKVVVFPGHQMGKVENNVILVTTPEGLSFCHLGDQINEGNFMTDYDWIDHVAEKYKVDVLMPPCWTNEIFRIVKGFKPKLVLPGHENELGHSVDDRVPYWGDSKFLELTYPELKNSKYKVIPTVWGESIHFRR